ncbi:MAG: hypothetical protein JWQ09_1608 [Segetibacter sp.]|nr:hypothetical protein [Segetibacter sp.]
MAACIAEGCRHFSAAADTNFLSLTLHNALARNHLICSSHKTGNPYAHNPPNVSLTFICPPRVMRGFGRHEDHTANLLYSIFKGAAILGPIPPAQIE